MFSTKSGDIFIYCIITVNIKCRYVQEVKNMRAQKCMAEEFTTKLTAVSNVLVEPATAIRGATVAMFKLLLAILVIDLAYLIIIMVGQLL